jgi:hypothetical protein
VEVRGYIFYRPEKVDQEAMTVEAMAKVERRYSRKVGDSFRRDKEHLALFEELADHDDLDSSLGNLSPPPSPLLYSIILTAASTMVP